MHRSFGAEADEEAVCLASCRTIDKSRDRQVDASVPLVSFALFELSFWRLEFVSICIMFAVSVLDKNAHGWQSEMLISRGSEPSVGVYINVYRRVSLSLNGKLHVVVVEATLPEVAKSFASGDGE